MASSLSTSTSTPLSLPRIVRRKSSSSSRFSSTKISCSRSSSEPHDRQNYGGHRLVDENLIILRKRIHEMKMIERNYEPPSEWMEWEKRHYASYDAYICEAMGFLQSQLMNTRPSLGIGIMALMVFCVPTSTVVVMSHFMDIISAGLSGIHF